MAASRKPKYTVKECDENYWDGGRFCNQPKFKLIMNGELICEMTSSVLMEDFVRQRFNELARRLNADPFEIDLKRNS